MLCVAAGADGAQIVRLYASLRAENVAAAIGDAAELPRERVMTAAA
jgi:hypothetical protein